MSVQIKNAKLVMELEDGTTVTYSVTNPLVVGFEMKGADPPMQWVDHLSALEIGWLPQTCAKVTVEAHPQVGALSQGPPVVVNVERP